MNRIYRNVWNEVTRTYVAAAEIVRGRGKRSKSSATAQASEAAMSAVSPEGLMAAIARAQSQAQSAATKAQRRLRGAMPRPMLLEQRFMFDGAALVDGVDTVSKALDAYNTGTKTVDKTIHLDIVAPAGVTVSDTVRTAKAEAEKLMADFLARPDAKEQLFALFNGCKTAPDAAWNAAFDQLMAEIQSGGDSIRVELRSGAELQGAHGAFVQSGPDGSRIIYLNADWASSGATASQMAAVLVEEAGHSLDAVLNQGADTAGDEGARFVIASMGNSVQQDAESDEDHLQLSIDGHLVSAEASTTDGFGDTDYNSDGLADPLRLTTWNSIGLDSNRPLTQGPNSFLVGIRVDADAAGLSGYKIRLVEDSNVDVFGTGSGISDSGNYIDFTGKLVWDVNQAANTSKDYFFNVEVDRSSSAFGAIQPFHIELFKDLNANDRLDVSELGIRLDKFTWLANAAVANTPLYLSVEKLISQARNDVENQTEPTLATADGSLSAIRIEGINADGSIPAGPVTVFVGQTLNIRVEAETSTAYPQLTQQTTFDSDVFRIDRSHTWYSQDMTDTTYQQSLGAGDPGATSLDGSLNPDTTADNEALYANSAGWNPTTGDLLITSAPPKAGGKLVTDYTVTVIGAGGGDLNSFILDYSGTSFHYNGDFGEDRITFNAVHGSILGTVSTITGSRLSSVQVKLYRNDGAGGQDGDFDGDETLVATTTTAANGNYLFTDLLPDRYIVVESQPSGYDDVRDTDTDGAGLPTANTRNVVAVNLEATSTLDTAGNLGVDSTSITSTLAANDPIRYVRADFVERSQAKADLSLTITASDTTELRAGKPITYTITVVNQGPDAASGISVKDTIGETVNGWTFSRNGVIVSSSAASGTSYNAAADLWTIGSLNVGETAVLTVESLTPASLVGGGASVGRSAQIQTANETDIDSTPGDNSTTQDDDDSVTLTPAAANDDVELTMVALDVNGNPLDLKAPLAAGSTVIYRINALSFFSSDLNQATIMMALPKDGSNNALLNIVSVTQTSGGSAPTIEYNKSTSSAGPTASNDWQTTASTNTTYILWQPDAAGGGTKVAPGDDVFLDVRTTLKSSLTGGSSLTASAWWSQYSQTTGVDIDSRDTSGSTVDVTLTDVLLTDPLDNSTRQPSLVQNDDEAVVVIAPQNPDLKITKSVSNAAPNLGDTVTFTITLQNDGQGKATNVEIRDLFPADGNLTYVAASASDGATYAGNGAAADTLTWSGINLLAGGSKTFTYQATVASSGTAFTNTAEIMRADQPDADYTVANAGAYGDGINTGDDLATVAVTGQAADLSLTKTSSIQDWGNATDKAAIEANGYFTATFTLTLSNSGPNTATGIEVKDELPPELRFLSATASSGSYDHTTGLWKVTSLASGSSATLTLQVAVDSPTAITNYAQVARSDQPDPNSTPNNNSTNENDDDQAIVNAPIVDLSLEKTVNNVNPAAGDTITYTVTLKNADGFDTATGIEVTETLPTGLVNVNITPSVGSYSGGIWSVNTLAGGASATLTIVGEVASGAAGRVNLTNVVEITKADQFDIDSKPNNRGHEPEEDDTAKSSPGQWAWISGRVYDDGAGYVRNNFDIGDDPLMGVTIKLWSDAGIDAGGAATGIKGANLLVTTTTDAWGTYSFYAPAGSYVIEEADPQNYGGDPTKDYSSIASLRAVNPTTGALTIETSNPGFTEKPLTVVAATDYHGNHFLDAVRNADLNLTKSVNNASPMKGSDVMFTLTVTNQGPDAATGVTVDDDLPTGLTFVAASSASNFSSTVGDSVYNPTTGIWTIGNLANGETRTLYIKATAATASNVVNSATVDGNQIDPDGTDDTATASVDAQEADLNLTKVVNNASPMKGDDVVFTLTVSNQGPDAATGVTVNDELPSGLTFVAASTASNFATTVGSSVYDPATGIWNIGNLANAATTTLYIKATAVSASNVVNSATVDGAQPDPDATDDTATASLDAQMADLRLVKTVDVYAPIAGSNVVFTLTVTNNGPDAATTVTVDDDLPAGLAFVAASTASDFSSTVGAGVYNPSTGIWTVGNLANGASATLYIKATADATAATDPGVVNTAVADSDQPDDNTNDNTSRADVKSVVADLSIVKSLVTSSAISVGSEVVYSLTASNIATAGYNFGTGNVASVIVNDDLPAGLEFIAASYQANFSSTTTDYSATTGEWTIGTLLGSTPETLYIKARVLTNSAVVNVASISGATPDINPNNDRDEASLTADGLPLVAELAEASDLVVLDESVGADPQDTNAASDDFSTVQTIGLVSYTPIGRKTVDFLNLGANSDFGPDGQHASEAQTYAVSASSNGLNAGVETADGFKVFLWNESSKVIGRKAATTGAAGAADAAGAVVFSVEVNPSTGAITVTQFAALNHPTGGSSSPDEFIALTDASLNASVTIKDSDGDILTSTALDIGAHIRFEDDGPTAASPDTSLLGTITPAKLDESALTKDGVYTGVSIDLSAAFGTTAAGNAGTDGGDISYTVSLAGATSVGSGLFVLDTTAANNKGAEIMLVDNGNGTVKGVANGTTDVFTLSVNRSGVVSFAFANTTDPVNLWHPGTASGDDSAELRTAAASKLLLTQTITDKDGDKASASIDLAPASASGSAYFVIEDDGPNATSVTPGAPVTVTLDEISLTGASISNTGDFSAYFASTTDYGTDGAGSEGYSLVLNAAAVNSGLFALGTGGAQGGEIVLSMDGIDVVGKVNTTEYLRISVNSSGVVTFTQLENIWNANLGATSTLSLGSGVFRLVQTVTDADGDTDSEPLDLGANGAFKVITLPPLSVNDIEVNEGSPYAVFTVTGVAGQYVKLALSSGSATIEDGSAPVKTDGSEDFGPGLEYWDPTAGTSGQWIPYTPGSFVQIPAGGTTLSVRTTIISDSLNEGDHDFTLRATNTGGVFDDGTGTIDDQGGGSKWPDGPPPPSTPTPGPGPTFDDDRPLTVNDIEVNEGSPYAVFTVTGVAGQYVKLALSSGSATIEDGSAPVKTDGSEDFGPGLEYWDPTAGTSGQWIPYTPGSFVQIPAGGTTLSVRTTIISDSLNEGDHDFTLRATNTGGVFDDGTGTIDDQGGGSKWPDGPPPPSTPTPGPGPTFDDDRPLTVNDIEVNEGSPYAVFTVTGVAGQYVKLALSSGSATIEDGSAPVKTDGSEDFGPGLEYWDPTAGTSGQWIPYTPGSFVQIPAGGTTLSVRTTIISDSLNEGDHDFTLRATNTGGVFDDGTGTIDDQGGGSKWPDGPPPPSTPTPGPGPTFDDDRPLTVNDIEVNEGSPYAVFTVTGVAGQYVKLALSSGSATIEDGSAPVKTDGSEDFGPGLEYWDPTAGTSGQWIPYTPGSFVQIPAGGTTLSVRTTIISDSLNEGDHDFTLRATNTGGVFDDGTGTIDDQGGGSKWPDGPPPPSTPTPGPGPTFDDDRPLTVNDIEVNEGSPYAVFTVTGVAGQYVKLALSSGSATIEDGSAPVKTDGSEDFGPGLEYWDPTAGTSGQWIPYTPGSFVQIPAGGTTLSVRTTIISDSLNEGDHDFTLRATNTGGVFDDGTGTIDDQGGGSKWPDGPPPPSTPTPGPGPTFDDDRPLTVNDIEVNEGSPYAVFTVTGVAGQYVKLALSSGSATIEDGSAPVKTDGSEDFGPGLEYWDPTAGTSGQWIPYTPGSFVQIPAGGTTLSVRTTIISDSLNEGDHDFTLRATNTGGVFDDGTGTIDDQGGGSKWPDGPPPPSTPTPGPGPTFDDDRPLTVNDIEVNEGSPYAVFTVTGVAGQYVKLALSSGSATIEDGSAPVKTDGSEDFGPGLEYWDPTAGTSGQWIPYTPGSFVQIPAGGTTLSVRTTIISDSLNEGDHDFTLRATNTGGVFDDGTGTIDDQGGGSKWPDGPPPPSTPTPGPGPTFDDDRPLTVNDIEVNEGSPYAVFTVTGVAGQYVKLALSSGSATIEDGSAPVKTDGSEDFGPGLEYWDPTAGTSGQWIPYTPGSFVQIPAGGTTLSVRTTIISDSLNEGDHDFTLRATNTGGVFDDGTGTIDDQGGGSKWPDGPPPPSTPTPGPGPTFDDDRPLTVNDIEVNEGSPYAVFTVTGVAGQYVKLALSSGSATIEDGSAPVKTDGSEDFGPGLEYWDPTAGTSGQWIPYTPGSFVQIPAGGTTLSVRTTIISDSLNEGDHDFTLRATNTGGVFDDGTGTIDDQGGGSKWPDGPPPPSTPTPGPGPTFDDDRPLTVNDIEVNEGSPYAVFTVTGVAGQYVKLALSSGSATIEDGSAPVKTDGSEDFGPGLEYWDPTAGTSGQWIPYTPGSFVQIPAGGTTLSVRTTIISDSLNEGDHDFTLRATNTGGVFDDGTGTIDDQGGGSKWPDGPPPPSTPTPGPGPTFDDDRPLTVNDIEVNEGSPYAVFTVTGVAGQYVKLALSSGSATIEDGSAPVKTDGSEDFGPGLEYWDPTAGTSGQWIPYTPGSFVQIPAGGTTLSVRTTIISDSLNEGDHDFTLRATNTGGVFDDGTGTIDDQGGGSKWPDGPPPPSTPTPGPGPTFDDDRPLTVNDIEVNEGSPYAVFTVTGVAGQYVKLALSSGSATIEDGSAPVKTDGSEDFGPGLEYWDPTAGTSGQWIPYTPGSFVQIPAGGTTLSVRTTIISDSLNEGDHDFTLRATNTGGVFDDGTGTIDDQGGGSKWPDGPPPPSTPTPGPGPTFDDDRPLTVNDIEVNEGSPYAVFTVTGVAGQYVKLALSSGSATIEDGSAPVQTDGSEDFGPGLEYWDPTAGTSGQWIPYTPGSFVQIPAGGTTLSVRTTIISDSLNEGDHDFTLRATNTGGVFDDGTGTIDDQGGGSKWPDGPPPPSTPTPGPGPTFDDDRPLTVNDIEVNEGSPYAVFTVTGVAGQYVKLALSSGSATIEDGSAPVKTDGSEDFGPGLEYWDPTAGTSGQWIPYTPGSFVQIPAGGTTLSVRTTIISDSLNEGDHDFTLRATNTGGVFDDGTGTIDDQGGGSKWPDGPPPPSTPTPGPGPTFDDDRPLTVNDIEVNEGSPYAVFTVTGVAGQYVKLALSSGSATIEDGSAPVKTDGSEDFGPGLEYWDPTAGTSGQWIPYTPGSFVQIPAGGTTLSVRTTIISDSLNEGDHDFTLRATNTGGVFDDGTGTIDDQGGGSKWPDGPPPPSTPTPGPGPTFDDDRPLTVNDIEVNEGSPYAVFTVTGVAGQYVKLALSSGSATIEDGSAPVQTDGSEDFGPGLEYWDPTAGTSGQWIPYTPGSFVQIPAGGTTLSVRTTIISDSLNEGDHDFTLRATNTGGVFDDGTGTIDDQGGGSKWPDGPPPPSTPTPGPGPTFDDDRPLTVNDIEVNEGSPYAVFTVTGVAGQYVKLALSSGSATIEDGSAPVKTDGSEDFGPGLEYWDPTAGTSGQWIPYTPGSFVQIPAGGTTLSVRTTIISDSLNEGDHDFTLRATNTGGVFDDGTGTIDDQGGGSKWPDGPPPPSTPTPGPGPTFDDDRPLTVNDIEVNEGSPYAVFTVTGVAGQYVKLALSSGSATIEDGSAPVKTDGSEDFGPGLEYWDPTAGTSGQWIPYTPGSFVQIPAGGTTLSVRTTIISDSLNEGDHDFTLRATNTGGVFDDGTGTIDDQGGGSKWPDGPPPPSTPTPGPGPTFDDDRPLTVNDIEVNEGSPYAVFTVTGVAGQYVKLALSSGSATIEDGSAPVKTDGSEDFGPGLEYWDPTAGTSGQWIPYTPGSFVQIPAGGTTLSVRTTIISDSLNEGDHDFTLRATNTGGVFDDGTGTIDDQGGGSKWPDGPPPPSTPTPGPGPTFDDDRPLTVNDIEISESSPFGIFKVAGASGQLVKLQLLSGTANLENGDGSNVADGSEDFGPGLEYFDGTNWQPYTPGSFVRIPDGSTTLLVRVPIVNDAVLEGKETFQLIATNTGGTSSAPGTASVFDDGTNGKRFEADNNSGDPTDGEPNDDTPIPPKPPVIIPPEPETPKETPPAPEPQLVIEFKLPPIEPVPVGDIVTSSSGFPITVIEGSQPTLVVFSGITDQFVEARGVQTVQLPADAFAHTRSDAVVTLIAQLSDGSPLPANILFNSQAGTFQVTPRPGVSEELEITVIARDGEGREAATKFKLNIGEAAKPTSSLSRPALTELLRSASVKQRDGAFSKFLMDLQVGQGKTGAFERSLGADKQGAPLREVSLNANGDFPAGKTVRGATAKPLVVKG